MNKRLNNRYIIEHSLGQGAFGAVYRAFDPQLERQVAIKALKKPEHFSVSAKEFHKEEARVLAQLDHPHVVTIFDIFEQDQQWYLVMQLVEGKSLAHILHLLKRRKKRLPYRQIGRIIHQLGDALDYIHQKGVIHRDVKPSNILIDNVSGQALLGDFGLALFKQTSPASGFAGTPEYAAPEQFDGRVTNKSDLYALGVILYEMVTGSPPFTGKTSDELKDQHWHRYPRPPRRIVPQLSQPVEKVILAAIEKAPAKRYTSGAALAADLIRALETQAAQSARPQPASTQPEADLSLPTSLLSEFAHQNVVLFCGQDLLAPDYGIFHHKLAQELATEVGASGLSLPELAGRYVLNRDHFDLKELVCQYVEGFIPQKPTPIHHTIAKLAFSRIIDINWDSLLETSAPRLKPIVFTADLNLFNTSDPRLIKLCGSVNHKTSLAITDDDLRQLSDQKRALVTRVQEYFRDYAILFVGCNLGHSWFKDMFTTLTALTDHRRRAYYAVLPSAHRQPHNQFEQYWVSKNTHIIWSSPLPFFQELLAQLEHLNQKYEERLPADNQSRSYE